MTKGAPGAVTGGRQILPLLYMGKEEFARWPYAVSIPDINRNAKTFDLIAAGTE